VALLYARPLQELSAVDLEKYAFKAMTTWGDSDDFKHFLPRIFELLTVPPEDTLAVEPEIAIGKLAYARWKEWPENEQVAIVNFLKAWMHWRLVSKFNHYSNRRVSNCLESIAIVEENFAPYLAIWRVDFFALKQARLNTAAFLDFSQEALYEGRFAWTANPTQAGQVINWLLEPEVLPLMEKTVFEFLAPSNPVDPILGWILTDGISALKTLKMLFPGLIKPETQA
jgi:hypothetical protein